MIEWLSLGLIIGSLILGLGGLCGASTFVFFASTL